MIIFENVTVEYDEENALENVSFEIEQGEFVSLVGFSGAGKTTIFKLLLAEVEPVNGAVLYQGEDIHDYDRDSLLDYRRQIGVVFQDFRLLKNKTVQENISFTMQVAGYSDEQIKSDVPHVLKLVNLSGKARSFPHELSGGEKQRVAIARAIINQPKIILADEPTGNLDPVNTYEILDILKQINEKMGTTVILSTHDRGVIDAVNSRVITLENGKLMRDDPTGQFIL